MCVCLFIVTDGMRDGVIFIMAVVLAVCGGGVCMHFCMCVLGGGKRGWGGWLSLYSALYKSG